MTKRTPAVATALEETASQATTVERIVAMPKEAWPTGTHGAQPAETMRPAARTRDHAQLRIPAFGAEKSGILERLAPESGEVPVSVVVTATEGIDVRSLVAARAIDAQEAQMLHRILDPGARREVAESLRRPEIVKVVARLEARGLVVVRAKDR